MARYIDAEALTDHMLERYNDLCEKHGDYDHYTTGYGDAIDAIENAPTADVVPKSEVEVLIKSVDDMLDLVCAMTGLELIYLGKYAELKKKYTEDKKDDNEN